MAVDNGQIDPLRLVAFELFFQRRVSIGAHREHHEARRVSVDPVDDQGQPLATRAEMRLELLRDRRVGAVRERHRQQAWRLVNDDQRVVLVDDVWFAGPSRTKGAAARRARPIHPHPDEVAGRESPAGVAGPGFRFVDEDFSALQRGQRPPTRPEPDLVGQKFVEPYAPQARVHPPPIVVHAVDGTAQSGDVRVRQI